MVGITRTLAVVFGSIILSLAQNASGAEPWESETDVFAISRGGQIYDDWIKAVEADEPKATHPAWPKSNTSKSGSVTWRCKSCHGWDYMGRDGAYGTGSYKTGIKGIREWSGRDVTEIVAVIRNETHGYSKAMLSDTAAQKTALFVARGQIDMRLYIDDTSRKARGDVLRGARLYQTICAVCHGPDGKMINFDDEKTPEFVGTVASENPWETLHKIRNGQPGVPMVAMAALGIQDQVDILAYTQTLPAK